MLTLHEENRAQRSIGPLTGFKLVGRLGSGRRCTVWQARRGTELVAVKIFNSRAIAKHASRHHEPLARFEFNRNRQLYAVPGLRNNIVRPVSVIDRGHQQILMQDVVCGETVADFRAVANDRDRQRICAQLVRIVAAAHDASIFDLDIHSGNILISRARTGQPNVMLFDFNKIPFHEWPPNALAGCLLRLGWIGPRSRDFRLLRALRKALY
jgi:hypothetical protein